MRLIKPQKLNRGDKVATVSLSWGGAGDSDTIWRYNVGKKRLEDEFGLNVVEMPYTLKGTEYVYNHPGKRAEDLMKAFEDKSIKAIFSCIGGYERVLFSSSVIGAIEPSPGWTSEYLPWEEKNWTIKRNLQPNAGYELLQGNGIVRGCLIGGCIEVLEMLKGTELWPDIHAWNDTILFFETSEDKPDPTYFEYWLRNYGSQGILNRTNGIIFGKPYNNQYYEDYKKAIIKVVRDELNLIELPILCNMNFGHTAPMMILPYGAMAEIDCDKTAFSILESGVV